MAFVVGFINVRFAAVYALGEYIAPIGLIGFGAIYADSENVLNRLVQQYGHRDTSCGHLRSLSVLYISSMGRILGTRGDFEGYLGTLEPTKMTVFDNVDRGPAATFLCGGLSCWLCDQR